MGNTGSTQHPNLESMVALSKEHSLTLSQIEFLYIQFAHPAALADNQKLLMKMVLTSLFPTPPSSFTEFVLGVVKWRSMDFEERIGLIFDLLDSDGNGHITASDLTIMVQHVNGYSFQLGDRVKVKYTLRRGILRFSGPTKFAEGIWAGMELEEPSGTHNGTVENETYFTVDPQRGAFVKKEFIELEAHYNIASDMLRDFNGSIGLEGFIKVMESVKNQVMADPLPLGLE